MQLFVGGGPQPCYPRQRFPKNVLTEEAREEKEANLAIGVGGEDGSQDDFERTELFCNLAHAPR